LQELLSFLPNALYWLLCLFVPGYFILLLLKHVIADERIDALFKSPWINQTIHTIIISTLFGFFALILVSEFISFFRFMISSSSITAQNKLIVSTFFVYFSIFCLWLGSFLVDKSVLCIFDMPKERGVFDYLIFITKAIIASMLVTFVIGMVLVSELPLVTAFFYTPTFEVSAKLQENNLTIVVTNFEAWSQPILSIRGYCYAGIRDLTTSPLLPQVIPKEETLVLNAYWENREACHGPFTIHLGTSREFYVCDVRQGGSYFSKCYG
jgi:hypothetical protein